jgi:hypothetical protein
MTPFAQILTYRNRRQKVAGLVRSIFSSVVDMRDPIRGAARSARPTRGDVARLTDVT